VIGSRRVIVYAIAMLLGISLAVPAVVLAARRDPPADRTFYVALNGSDSNRGTSMRHPWRTVTRVDRAALRPGDTVLFYGGETFADNSLMPGDGFTASGTARARIVFGSYGRGMAKLTDGIWFGADAQYPSGPRYLTFTNLALGPEQGFQGTGDYITIRGLRIADLLSPASDAETGILSEGSHWVITHNTINRVGGSGMLLGFTAGEPGDPPGGYDYMVDGNVITHTGLDPALTYGSHGIYLKVADATIAHNWIANFRDDGISARYRDATIVDDHIAHGGIGIAWYQYDDTAGTSRFAGNVIAHTGSAGIFVCGAAEGCLRPIENFVIEHNTLRATRDHLNLQPTLGRYKVRNNGPARAG
jgi:hypothetical protein